MRPSSLCPCAARSSQFAADDWLPLLKSFFHLVAARGFRALFKVVSVVRPEWPGCGFDAAVVALPTAFISISAVRWLRSKGCLALTPARRALSCSKGHRSRAGSKCRTWRMQSAYF